MEESKIQEIEDRIENKYPDFRVESYTPDSLTKLISLDNILLRVPDNYLSAIVATKLATGFVYRYGLDSNEVDFYNYLQGVIE